MLQSMQSSLKNRLKLHLLRKNKNKDWKTEIDEEGHEEEEDFVREMCDGDHVGVELLVEIATDDDSNDYMNRSHIFKASEIAKCLLNSHSQRAWILLEVFARKFSENASSIVMSALKEHEYEEEEEEEEDDDYGEKE